MGDSVTSSHSRQCRYFAVASKGCYTPWLRRWRLHMWTTKRTFIDNSIPIFENNPFMYGKICTYMGTEFWVRKTQKWRNFHGMIQCYGLMLRIAVTLHSNFLHLVTSLQTALVIEQCYVTVLHYMSVPTFILCHSHLLKSVIYRNGWASYNCKMAPHNYTVHHIFLDFLVFVQNA